MNVEKKEDSFKKRYVYKLFTNIFGMAIGLITVGIVPRALGPISYGDFGFLTNFFSQITSFLDMGTSTAFYTKLSKKQADGGLVLFYLYFVTIVSFLIGIFVLLATITPLYQYIWPGQGRLFIIFAALFGVLSWVSLIWGLMVDAYGLTVSAEILKVVQRIAAAAIIIILFLNSKLNLLNYFVYQLFITFLLLIMLIWLVKNNKSLKITQWFMPKKTLVEYAKEYYHYCHPLFIYSLIVLGAGIAERWLLQIFGGSAQQGFFTLSFNLSAFYVIFTSAMVPLLLREFSVAHSANDVSKMAKYYNRYGPLLYTIAAYFSCFVVLEAGKITQLLAGNRFEGAVIPIAIMALYPIHQTYGQINGSILFASNQTKLYRNTGVLMALIGLPVTLWFIAPIAFGGLNLGANGLAIKTVVFQFVAVNLQFYFIAKYLRMSFVDGIRNQLVTIGALMLISFLSILMVNSLFAVQSVFFSLFFAGALYSAVAIFAAYLFPALFGIDPTDIILLKAYLWGKLVKQ